MSLPLGAALPLQMVDVEILHADPTTTATAGKRGGFGLFGGNLYVHLTAAEDTSWLNLGAGDGGGGLWGVIPCGAPVVAGPAGVPPTNCKAFEAIDNGTDPNSPDIVRPEGSILVSRNGLSGWIRAAQNWQPLGAVALLVQSVTELAILATMQNKDGAQTRVVRCQEVVLDHSDIIGDNGALQESSILLAAIPPNVELPYNLVGELHVPTAEVVAVRMRSIENFANTYGGNVYLAIGTAGSHGAIVREADMHSATGQIGLTTENSGEADPRTMDIPGQSDLWVTIRIAGVEADLSSITAGKVRVELFYVDKLAAT